MRPVTIPLVVVMLPLALSSQQPATWRVSAKPILQIGEVDGDSAYMFYRVVNALRLPDGRIAVLNAGSHQLRVYDARGQIVFARGRRGRGPGEFNQPSRLYRSAPDTFTVFDRGNRRLSMHTLAGNFVREQPMIEANAYDDWLYRRSWIDGPPEGKGRALVRAAVDQLPPPDPAVGIRFIRISPQGHLWVRGPIRPNAPVNWTVYDLDAKPLARVTTPARFDLHEIGRDYLLGVGRDEFDVEYVQLFRLEGASTVRVGRLIGPDPSPTRAPRAIPEEVVTAMESAFREVRLRQEIFYSVPANDYTYAGNVSEFGNWQASKGFIVHLVRGTQLGWLGILVHQGSGIACGIAVGGPTFFPPAWTSTGGPRSENRLVLCE